MKIKHKNRANKFCTNHGYDSSSFYSEWNGFEVYRLVLNDNDGRCTGYPEFLLLSEKDERLASPDETLDIMGIYPTEDRSGESL